MTLPNYSILPPLLDDEFQHLKSSIEERGVEVPIVVDQDNEIIDGIHRQKACDELGVFCPREVRHFESDAERFEVILSLNCRRRQLNREQKRRLIEAYLIRDPQIADNHLGELIGVSKNTVSDVRRELERTCQIDKLTKLRGKDGKVRRRQKRVVANTANEAAKATAIVNDLPESGSGRVFDIITAQRRAKLNRQRIQKRHEEDRISIPEQPRNDPTRIVYCRFQELERLENIDAESVPLILTDPPYGDDFIGEWDSLGAFAERILKPGGLFVAYAGHHRLDEKMQMLSEHLTYRWTINSSWIGKGNHVRQLNVVSRWVPVLVYSKGDPPWRNRWTDGFTHDPYDKLWHEWEKSLDEIEKLLNDFSDPGDLVVDPCGGGFTTAIACERMGRRCISCDVDKAAVVKGLRRLQEQRQTVAEEPFGYTLPVDSGRYDDDRTSLCDPDVAVPMNVESSDENRLKSVC